MARTVGSAADDTRQRILDVAVDLFIEQGYAGTSVRDISERLGMTKGSLYYHFASKEDLLSALLMPLVADLDAFIEDAEAAVAAGLSPIRDLVERLVGLLDQHGVLLRSLMSDPAALHGLRVKKAMPRRLLRIQQVLGGGGTQRDLLRGRCALGVVHAGAVAPRRDTVEWPTPGDRAAALRRRLSPEDKNYVVDAVLAVLAA